jgi:hypothetical protein
VPGLTSLRAPVVMYCALDLVGLKNLNHDNVPL